MAEGLQEGIFCSYLQHNFYAGVIKAQTFMNVGL